MSEFVNVRFGESDKALLLKVVKSRREDISSFVRKAVMSEIARLSYLTIEEKKALGVLAK